VLDAPPAFVLPPIANEPPLLVAPPLAVVPPTLVAPPLLVTPPEPVPPLLLVAPPLPPLLEAWPPVALPPVVPPPEQAPMASVIGKRRESRIRVLFMVGSKAAMAGVFGET
jgi:hypothetical protein